MISSILALAILASETKLAVPAPPPPPPEVPVLYAPTGTSGIGTYKLNLGTLDADSLLENFKNQLWLQDAEYRRVDQRPTLSREKFDKTYDFQNKLASLNSSKQWSYTTKRNTWIYQAPVIEGDWPTRALQIIDKSSPDGYHVEVIIHCYEPADNCRQYIAEKKQLPAPRPATFADDLSYAQWKNRVAAEPCQKLPTIMASPKYPVQELRDGVVGTVRIGVYFNACGNVRDAWVEQSSRNRNLDRAALNKAFEWQIDTSSIPVNPNKAGSGVVPISFSTN